MSTIFPTKQEEKNTYYHHSRARIDAEQTRLGISATDKAALDGLIDDSNCWDEVYPKHTSEDGNTTTVQNRVKELIVLIENQLTKIYKDIPASKLNSDDYTIFRLNPGGSSHASIVAQSTPGVLSLDSAHHLSHRMRIKNPLTPETDAMPHGNHAKVWWAVSPSRVASAEIKWGNNPRNMNTRFIEITFTEDQVGQFAAYRTCYENAKGEQGTPSEPFWVVII